MNELIIVLGIWLVGFAINMIVIGCIDGKDNSEFCPPSIMFAFLWPFLFSVTVVGLICWLPWKLGNWLYKKGKKK